MSVTLNRKDAIEVSKIIRDFNIKNVIFDLDGILIETDHKAIEHEMTVAEKMYMARYTVSKFGKPTKKWLFDALTRISADKLKHFDLFDEHEAYNENMKLPPIMCQWQVGIHSSEESKNLTLEHISDGLKKKIISKNEADVLTIISDFTYKLERFNKTRKLTEGGMYLLDLINAVAEMDNSRIAFAMITNFAEDQFKECKKTFSKLFSYFQEESIIVSSQEQMVKPNPQIYKIALERGRMDPLETIFIDDELKNIEGAFKSGIKYGYLPGIGILVNNK